MRMPGPPVSKRQLDHLLDEAANDRLLTDQGTNDEIDELLDRVAGKGHFDEEDRKEAHRMRRRLVEVWPTY